MKNLSTIITHSCLWILLLTACRAIPILDNTNLVQAGNILYADDFSSPKSGWPSW
jgi:hypothetical protein